MKLRERFARFMYGRYGMDQFGKFLLYLALAILIINCFINNSIVYYVGLAIMIYGYFRVFSKNIYKRSGENSAYLRCKEKFLGFWSRIFCSSKAGYSSNSSYNRTYDMYKIFKCPKCRQKLRVPRGKGKIEISCRKCGYSFIKKT